MPTLTGIAPTIKLNNGVCMPSVGLGTAFIDEKEDKELIKAAIDIGFRHFDTALVYHTENAVGQAIKEKIEEGIIKREDVFVTSKLWCSYAHTDLVIKGCKKTLRNLGLDYVDLYLMHWPFAFQATKRADEPISDDPRTIEAIFGNDEYFPKDSSGNLMMANTDYLDTWKEMEKCVELGLAKSIGVSNFNSKQLQRLLEHANIKPVTNQVEVHPYLNQKKLIEFCKDRDVIITCYGPLGSPMPPKAPNLPKVMENPVVTKLADKYKKTAAQIILRYLVQLGTIVIPKTSKRHRLLENISIFDFNLTADDMSQMNSLNCNDRIYILPGTDNHIHFPFKEEF